MGEAPSFNLPEGEYVFSGDVVVELEKVPEVNETTAPQMKPVPSELSPCGRDIVVYGLLDKIFIVSIDFIHKETCKREAMEKVPSRIVRLDARSSADAGSLEVATSLENGRVLLMTFDYIDGTYTTKGRKMRYFHVEPSIKAPAVEIAFIQGTEPGENPVERGSAGEIVDLFIGTENGEVRILWKCLLNDLRMSYLFRYDIPVFLFRTFFYLPFFLLLVPNKTATSFFPINHWF